MERLTERFKNGQAAVYGCGNNCKYDFKYCNNYLNDCPTINEIYDKLAEYEDLEEQGKLLKLLCAVGDTVWFIKSCFSFMSKPKAEKVGKIEIIPGEIIFITENRRFDIGSVGKTVFLTREKAEAALKELERGKGE